VRLVPWLAPVIVALAAWLASVPATAADTEQSGPVLSAATILGAIEETVAVVNRCREVDNSNAAIYNGLLVIFGVQNRPVIERLDVVLRGEGVRAGHRETYFLSLYSIIWKGARTEVEDIETKTGPAKFLANCRILPGRADQHTDLFAPLPDRFPNEMHTIDEWH
jgi:hypothetical protein